MRKLIYIVCGLNASRSQAVEEFLKGKYPGDPEIEIKSAGFGVDIQREDDKRTPFTKELAERTDIIFVSDHDKLSKYYSLGNIKDRITKVHLLRIPDVFHTHRNAYLPGSDGLTYEEQMQKIESEPEFSALRRYVSHLTPEGASALTEALYLKELYPTHSEIKKRYIKYPLAPWDESLHKKYPFQLLQKTLEFRFPQIHQIIKSSN
jgi:predicted protein tyrosine phosphatase